MPTLAEVQKQLEAREPIFHRPEFGTTRADFAALIADDFWEIGASGRRYSRDFILDVLEERHRTSVIEDLQATEFECRQLCENTFLLHYLLQQPGRLTRRTSIWRRVNDAWKIAFHQGTVVHT